MSHVSFDVLRRLQETTLQFPAFLAAFEQIERNLRLYRETGVAQHLLVLGESGTGKTTLARWFSQRYPRQRLVERDVIPVLHVSVPAAATIAGTVEAVLAQLGDHEPERGTVSVKTARAAKLARACGVEMLLFDEAQHIHDRGRSHTHYFVGDWLKSFMDALGLPVTLLGLPRTQVLLQVNEQLRRRFARRLSLSVQETQSEANEEASLALFSSLAQVLPLPLTPHPYDWHSLGERLYYATDGRIAYVKQLLIAAYCHASDVESEHVSPMELAHAFTQTIWPAGVGALNPFEPKFVFRALDRMGEPFQAGDAVGSGKGRPRA